MKRSNKSYTIKNIKAWVVFCKNTDIWWLKFLKIGYRHCFLILYDGYNWITYDPMSSFTDINVHKTEFHLPSWFSENGYTVVETSVRKCHTLAPISIYSCVEGVKRILGIQSFAVLTPYQLYKHLKERN